MGVETAGGTRSGIGARLRAGRERRGLTILQAAEKMHVDARILESLEAEDFIALGAPVFARGHLRHYAELVGEPVQELQSLYSSTGPVAQPDLTRVPRGEASGDNRRLAAPAGVVLLGFAIIGAVWWVLTMPKAQMRTRSVHAPAPAQASTPAQAPAQASTPAQANAPAQVRAPAQANTPAMNLSGRSQSSASAPAVAQAAGRDRLTLRFTNASWLEVYDSGGSKLFYDTAAAGSVRSFEGTPPMRVVLGNAPGVTVQVNGHAADLASLTRGNGSALFIVDRSGHVNAPSP